MTSQVRKPTSHRSRRFLRVTATAGLALALLAGLASLPAGPANAADNAAKLDALVRAYPDFLAGHDGNELLWKDGTRMPFDDGRKGKSFEDLLNSPDLEDQFYAPYPAGAAAEPPGFEIDPGRVRYEPFFDKMYGDCRRGEVAGRMVSVPWVPGKRGGSVQFTTINGAAAALEKVSRELDALPANFTKYLKPSAGTFNCRVIAGTDRRSVHAYGAAIDISVEHAGYWRWSKPGKDGRYRYSNKIPMEIVRIFERHGFIWGGRWYHFDTMHFEYRPELLPMQ